MTTANWQQNPEGFANSLVESVGDEHVGEGMLTSVLRRTVTMLAETSSRPPPDTVEKERLRIATAAACDDLTRRVKWLQKGGHEAGTASAKPAPRTGREPNSLVLLRRTLNVNAEDGDATDRNAVRSTAWVGRVLGPKDPRYEKPTSQNVGGRFVQLYVADCILAMDPSQSVIPDWIKDNELGVYSFLVEATTRMGWQTQNLTIGECRVVHAALDELGYPPLHATTPTPEVTHPAGGA